MIEYNLRQLFRITSAFVPGLCGKCVEKEEEKRKIERERPFLPHLSRPL